MILPWPFADTMPLVASPQVSHTVSHPYQVKAQLAAQVVGKNRAEEAAAPRAIANGDLLHPVEPLEVPQRVGNLRKEVAPHSLAMRLGLGRLAPWRWEVPADPWQDIVFGEVGHIALHRHIYGAKATAAFV